MSNVKTKPSTITERRRGGQSNREAVQLVITLSASYPKTGARHYAQTQPRKFIRGERKKTLEELKEILEGALRYRLSGPELRVSLADGTALERVRLISTPERDGYLVDTAEGTIDIGAWFLGVVGRYSLKRA